jgi:NAD(P)-dependent dehydrogenase (short-subunit alcohol dehydrogenase family)
LTEFPAAGFDLSGRVAVVTGAAGRLGPVWSEALLAAGARVVGLDLPGAKPDDRWQSLAARWGERVRLLPADVRSRPELDSACAQVRQAMGAATILVNNAGIDRPPGPGRTWTIADWPAGEFRDVLEVNVLGAFQASQAFAGDMADAGGGAIINIGSLYASVSPDARLYDHLGGSPPFLKPPAYGASKAALINLTRYLAAHWADRSIRVNALSPGGVRGAQDPTFQAKFTSRVPMGRMAEPDDLGGPLVFLASDASRYVTGINLPVDGGFTLW